MSISLRKKWIGGEITVNRYRSYNNSGGIKMIKQ